MLSAAAVTPSKGQGQTTSKSWRDIGMREHFVQFYDQDEFLVQAVSDYVAAGLPNGEKAMIIATPAHREAIRQRLARHPGMNTESLVELDAAQTLAKIVVNGTPDPDRFENVIGGLVRQIEAKGLRIRAFGEMVALLWEDGHESAAVRLEELWNDLASRHAFALFCAYPLAKFSRETDSAAFSRICKCHTRVIPAESFATLSDSDERERAISLLQQRASALESEVARRKEIEARLARRERELSDFLESAAEGLHQVGRDGKIFWANKAELDLLGYSADEYIGHDIREFHVDRDVIEAMLATLVRGERLYDAPARMRCKDGSIKHVLIHSSAYFEAGKFSHSRCFTRDVTRLKEAEEQQQRLIDRERAALAETQRISRMKDEFLANLSHELRTPLNAILGWTHVIKDRTNDSETVSEGIDVIERNARIQAQLIEDLLDISRIIAGQVGLGITSVPLIPLLQSALSAVRPAAESKQVNLRQSLDPLAGAVAGDPGRLQQVVVNLLSNAVKFTPAGGKVEVLLERVDSRYEITVRDSGCGIDPVFLPHVFERFRQEDASITRQHGGLGIGLSIVKQLVELHGGTVCAQSAGLGLGASFTVSLPVPTGTLPDVSATALRPDLPGDSAGALTARLKGTKILVVDDDQDSLALIARLIRPHGAKVFSASSVQEALDLWQTERPDVLVSDIGLSTKDGYELIREIRRRDPEGGIAMRAVALTAFTRSEDRVKALQAGYQMHLAKPIEPKELVLTVASLVARVSGL